MFTDIIIYLNAALVGSMIFFVSVVSPTVFLILKNDDSSKFLRTIFPRLFFFGFILSAISALISILSNNHLEFYSLLVISFLFILNRNFITPRINFYRDKENLGDINAKKYFKLLHLISVLLFITNFLILILLLLNNLIDFI